MASDAQALSVAMDLCRRFEGFRARPYLCPAGIPTIGYGATVYLGGRKVTLADAPISQDEAERLLQDLLERVYLPAALTSCPQASGGQLAALADFAFNLGCTRLATSTLRRRFNAGDMAGARAEIRKWVRGGGRVLPGLVARREAEAALLTDGTDD